MQDGGRAVQATMQESKQTVEEVKMVVAQARRKLGAVASPLNHFNEDDFMDGMNTPSPGTSPTKAATAAPPALAAEESHSAQHVAKYDAHQSPTTTILLLLPTNHLNHASGHLAIAPQDNIGVSPAFKIGNYSR